MVTGISRSLNTLLVEFGTLTPDQQTLIDLHVLRAVGTDVQDTPRSDGVVIAFWLQEGESPDAVFDDIRGWAIGNGLPVRGLVEG